MATRDRALLLREGRGALALDPIILCAGVVPSLSLREGMSGP